MSPLPKGLSKHNGNGSATSTSSFDADLGLLTGLLSQDADIDDSDSANVAELLRRLEVAEGLADGVETRLDGILDDLDNLLNDLELEASQGAHAAKEATAPASEEAGAISGAEGYPQK